MKSSFNNTLKNKKGQVGLEILLGVVVTIFIIGLLVFIFNYMGSEVEQQTFDEVSEYANTSATGVLTLTRPFATNGNFVAYNSTNRTTTSVEVIIPSNEYNISGASVTFGTGAYNQSEIHSTYDYYGTTSTVMNNTRGALAKTTDWFGVVITITAMIVLILLVTLIIRAIGGSGMTGGSGGSSDGSSRGEGGSKGSA